MNGEDQDQKDRKPEIGNGEPDLRRPDHGDIARTAAPRRREQAERHGQQHGDGEGGDSQRNRHDQTLGDQLGHGRPIGQAGSHIADQKTADPIDIAQDRIGGQAKLRPQRR